MFAATVLMFVALALAVAMLVSAPATPVTAPIAPPTALTVAILVATVPMVATAPAVVTTLAILLPVAFTSRYPRRNGADSVRSREIVGDGVDVDDRAGDLVDVASSDQALTHCDDRRHIRQRDFRPSASSPRGTFSARVPRSWFTSSRIAARRLIVLTVERL